MPSSEQMRLYRADPMAFARALVLPAGLGDVRFGDVMADFQAERFAKLAPDLLALQDRRQPPIGRHWWEATKGAAKDSDLAVAVIWLTAFSSRPIYGQIGAADQEQAGELRKAATATIAANPWLAERVTVDKNAIRCEASKAVAEIVTTDLHGSHGARPEFLVINELHAIPLGRKEVAENWSDNADKISYGIRVIATNAGLINTWQWKWRELARTSDRWYFHKFDRPAPWISPADLEESRRRNSTSRYQRLWLGIWVPATGDALDAADIEAALCDVGRHPRDGWVYGGGLDLGVKRDHAALVLGGTAMGSGRVAIVHVESWRPEPGGKVDLGAVRETAGRLSAAYQLVYLGYDPYQCELMAQDLASAGVPAEEMTFVGKNLDLMASTLMQSFRQRTIDISRADRALIDDLQRLTIVERKFGYKLTSVSDETGHADRAIAAAIMLPVMNEIANMASPADWSGLPACVGAA